MAGTAGPRARYKRAQRAMQMRIASGVLLLWFGFVAIGVTINTWGAWGWVLGEPVSVRVSNVCWGPVDSDRLTDCRGRWQTADGQSHEGTIHGFRVEHLGRSIQARAFRGSAYRPPSQFAAAYYLPAPFAGGIGVLLLGLSFAVAPPMWRRKAKRAQVQSEPLPADATAAAQASELGAEGESFWSADGFDRVVTVFENGFVHFPHDRPPRAFRWDEITVVLESAVHDRGVTSYEYTVQIGMSATMKLHSTEEGGVTDLPRLGKQIVERAADTTLPALLAELHSGRPATFPVRNGEPVVVTPEGVRRGQDAITWGELAEVDVASGYIQMQGPGSRTIALRWGDTGNAAVLVTLVHALIAAQR